MTEKRTTNLCVLAVNPGSTSTKVSVFLGRDEQVADEIQTSPFDSHAGGDFTAAVTALTNNVRQLLADNCITSIDAVVGRGGFIDRTHGPVSGGTYEVAYLDHGTVCVRQDIVKAVSENPEMEHASNLGIPVAAKLALELGVPAFCVDPVVADNFSPEARVSGYAPIERKSTAHALSVKMLGKLTAEKLSKPLNETRMVAVHMGGGITVAALKHGLMVDNNIALLGGGPFTPQRVGELPMNALIDLCYDSGMTKGELCTELTKRGGLMSYLGDDNMQHITRRINDGDETAAAVLNAMAYQVAKEIGAMAVAAGNPLDAVVFSGGLARSDYFLELITARIGHLGQVFIFPGSVEMMAMARGAMDVLTGKEKAIVYYLHPKN